MGFNGGIPYGILSYATAGVGDRRGTPPLRLHGMSSRRRNPLVAWYRHNPPLLRLAQVAAGLALVQVVYGIIKHWTRTRKIAAEATSLLVGANAAISFAIFLLLYEDRIQRGRRRKDRSHE